MPESSWLQRALESAIHETNVVEDRIGLARLTVLERLVSADADQNEVDALYETLDTLRALEWQRVSNTTEQLHSLVG